jgi:hypothetical protein
MRKKALLNDNWVADCFDVLRPFAPDARERSLFQNCCCFGRFMRTQGKGRLSACESIAFSELANLQFGVSWLADAVNAPWKSLTEFIEKRADRAIGAIFPQQRATLHGGSIETHLYRTIRITIAELDR